LLLLTLALFIYCAGLISFIYLSLLVVSVANFAPFYIKRFSILKRFVKLLYGPLESNSISAIPA